MSNEMISVSRELFEEIVEDAISYLGTDMAWTEYGTRCDEVRARYKSALLAKPAAQHQGNAVAARVCAYTPGLGQVELKLPGALPSWLELGEVVTVQQGGAQPQGEPVAMVRTHGSVCWEEITGESLELCQAQPEEYEVRTLYTRPAEQPAPVAVVLPERNKASQNLDLEQCGYVDGWNACLEEVARLNPPQQ
ncbi:hypothetical protein Q7O60_16345 [Pseudomonas protegens]|uniref:hypothetical protein n=1 Tax=Pseudomonas protegens TaxID=380021 RepID=UPI002761AA75|nr:hypothetical protein [Pseudomonas protegens]MDP9504568.1 hypothetical protein [Pseudomonas protegens]